MKVIDVYKQYFAAKCEYQQIERKGALLSLTATSDSGTIKYDVSITFFPHRDPEDFAVTYDAYVSKEIFNARGRRSQKREEKLLADIRDYADELAGELSGVIYWEHPLSEARKG